MIYVKSVRNVRSQRVGYFLFVSLIVILASQQFVLCSLDKK